MLGDLPSLPESELMITQEQFDTLTTAWQEDNVLGLETLFDVELTEQQKDLVRLADNQKARVAVSSCTGSGKTAVLSMLTLLYLMILPDCRILITSPSFNQLNRVFASEVRKWYRRMPEEFQAYYEITRETIRYTNTDKYEQFASLVTASVENKEALQGGHAANYVIFADEASGISEEASDILLFTLSTGKGGRFIQVSNPVRSSGRFYQIFQTKENQWDQLYFSALDSPNVNDEWIEEMADTYGDDSDLYRMRVLGKFPRVGVNQYIGPELIEEAIANNLELIDYHHFPKVMGVDIARFGDDKTVFVIRQGPKVHAIITYSRLNTMEVAARIAEEQAVHRCAAIYIDSIGVGAGTFDRCRELGLPVTEVLVSNKSTQPNIYCNLRAQLWGEMKSWLTNGADLPYIAKDPDTNLLSQACAMRYFYNGKMQLQLMAKKDLKKMGHESPDIADALSYTFVDTVYDFKPRMRARKKIKRVNFVW